MAVDRHTVQRRVTVERFVTEVQIIEIVNAGVVCVDRHQQSPCGLGGQGFYA